MAVVKTYNPKEVNIVFGSHIASGFAEDTFVSVEAHGDGVTYKVGCDGEMNRSISPDGSYVVKLTLMQGSPTNNYLQTRVEKDRKDGNGDFPVMIKDLMGNEKFSSDYAFVVKPANWVRGKDVQSREWEIVAADGKLENS